MGRGLLPRRAPTCAPFCVRHPYHRDRERYHRVALDRDYMLYNIENLIKEAKLSEKEKTKIIAEVREEFPQDEMLFELHLFRLLM